MRKNDRATEMKEAKQITTVVAIAALSAATAQARVVNGGFASTFGRAPIAENATWNDVRTRVEANPMAICQSVSDRVSYAPDRSHADEWRDGSDTWKRRAGDCEDIAQCVKEICDEKGIPADVYVFGSRTTGRGHAVTVGNWNGRMWMSSNGDYTEVSSISEVRKLVAQRNGWTSQDLETYRVKDTRLARGSMHGLERVSSAESRFVPTQGFVKPPGFIRPTGFNR